MGVCVCCVCVVCVHMRGLCGEYLFVCGFSVCVVCVLGGCVCV